MENTMPVFYDLKNFDIYDSPHGLLLISNHRRGPNGSFLVARCTTEGIYAVHTMSDTGEIAKCPERVLKGRYGFTAEEAVIDINHRCIKSAPSTPFECPEGWTKVKDGEPIHYIRLDWPMCNAKWKRLGVDGTVSNLERLQDAVHMNPWLWIEFISGSHDNSQLRSLVLTGQYEDEDEEASED